MDTFAAVPTDMTMHQVYTKHRGGVRFFPFVLGVRLVNVPAGVTLRKASEARVNRRRRRYY